MQLLFPQPFMPKGSQGPAVVVLQLLLKSMGFNGDVEPDGEYGEQTATAVQAFQKSAGIDEDGNFGPQTRKAFLEKTGIDVDAIPSVILMRKTVVPAH